MNFARMFAIKGSDSIISPEDSGLVNGKIAVNGWMHDLAEIRTLYAPPFFSDDFKLVIRFNGKRAAATGNLWEPDQFTRKGSIPGWSLVSRLVPVAGERAVIMAIEVTNRRKTTRDLAIEYEISGGFGRLDHWGFGKPRNCPFADRSFAGDILCLHHDTGVLQSASSLPVSPKMPVCSGVLTTPGLRRIAPGKTGVFYTFISVGDQEYSTGLIDRMKKDPEGFITRSRQHWQNRVKKLMEVMPVFESDNKGLEKIYYRSLLHLLINEWDVPEFLLHPYYATGAINGGCVCCYLWNYGEPYRLWSILNAKSAREHLKTYLKLDLSNCFAFFPEDGSPNGPYYPVNQEKVLFLANAYVLNTGDTAFLHEMLEGKSIIQHLVDQALMHDDLSKDAVLVNYKDGNNHLELRRELRYDGIVPDLNLRRCVNYHIADKLCRIAGYDPHVDLISRAENLKKLIRQELFSPADNWYYAIDMQGKKYLRYTMQMFKAIGWGDWAMNQEEENSLIKMLMDKDEFLGDFGIHSLSKKDPAYDERDVDNGGPGACISFAPAIADRLYMAGKNQEGDQIMQRLLWLGPHMPYWGDSQRADVMEYRRDTPLQSDIQGAALSQTIIFGLFGITVNDDFSIEVKPHLFPETGEMTLKNIRLAGMSFDIYHSASGTTVSCDGKTYHALPGEAIILPAVLQQR
ncbi:MAG: hypothetical protein E7043_06395 [Lentisphaerae bacterium]|nr:hypothetical protein [Lentisphaerota bacterium]